MFAIAYDSVAGHRQYWQQTHKFGKARGLDTIVTYGNLKASVKGLSKAINKFPDQFGLTRNRLRLKLINLDNNQEHSYSQCLVNDGSWEIVVNTDRGQSFYWMSDNNWTSVRNASNISRYSKRSDALKQIEKILNYPTGTCEIGVKEITLNTFELVHKNDDLSSNDDNKNTGLGDLVSSNLDDLLMSSSKDEMPQQYPMTISDCDKIDEVDVAKNVNDLPDLPDRTEVKRLSNIPQLNVDKVLDAIKTLTVLSNYKDVLKSIVHDLDMYDTQDLLHVIELDQLSMVQKIKILDTLTNIRQTRRTFKDLHGFAQAISDGVDFNKIERDLAELKLEHVNKRSYYYRNSDIRRWVNDIKK